MGEKVLFTALTLRDVITQYGSLTSISMTPSLFTAFRSAKKCYREHLEKEKAAKDK
jgi:hypothetical protein